MPDVGSACEMALPLRSVGPRRRRPRTLAPREAAHAVAEEARKTTGKTRLRQLHRAALTSARAEAQGPDFALDEYAAWISDDHVRGSPLRHAEQLFEPM